MDDYLREMIGQVYKEAYEQGVFENMIKVVKTLMGND